jgi:hypothetical protein
MNRFFDRDDSELMRGTRTEYEHALLLLEIYINSFGSVLLGASDTLPTFARPKDGPVSKRYNTDSVAKLFRGFALFFLRFKVNAPNEIKITLLKIIEEFVDWLIATGQLSKGFQINFEQADLKSNYLALHAFNVLSRTIANSTQSTKKLEDTHDSEPIYVVSRVKSGKLWFIYVAEDRRYDELGPVNVPRGVSDILKPGWLVDCAFGKFDGKWQITAVRRILPI